MGMRAEHTADIESLLAHAGWLRRFAAALVKDRDDAEDLAQDTMLRVWRHPAQDAGRAWLARVARNLAVDRFRATRRREVREQAAESAQPSQVANPEELVGDAQIHRTVAEVVAGLAEPFRQTIVLRFYEGRSSADIARGLGVPEGTVRWRLKEGLDRVRRELDARHRGDRSSWLALLTPLVPRPLPGESKLRPPEARTPQGFSLAGHVAVAVLGALVASTVALGIAAHARRARSTSTADEPARTANEAVLGPGKAALVRLNLANQAAHAAEIGAETAPGPERLDAQSLAEQLLQAVQDNDYDAFVAKGSAFFRAAVPTGGFASLSAKLGTHLAQGRRVSPLGSVRHTRTVDWIFKIEFTDGGDDALITVAMNGWQLAGFFVDDPTILPPEK